MRNRRSTLATACLLAVLASADAVEAQSSLTAWWNTDWQCRRRVTVLGRTEATSDDVCFVEFPTNGMAKPDGSDIRVLEGPGPVHSKVLFMGPGDLCKLAIKMSASKGPSTFYIYYGNPKASAPPAVWEPKRGCLLETRRYVGGGCGNWEQMQDTIRKSKGQTYGVGYVKNIFMGFNPFGPSENYISLFAGWIDCRQTGEYTFSTTSDEASFMFIDGKLVVQWPGHHGAIPQARFTGRMHLTRGIHKVEYYHLQTTDRAAVVAAWRPPGHPRILPIPEDAFTPISRGTVTGYEIRGIPMAVDFTWDNRGEALMGERLFYRVGFLDKTTGQSGTRATPKWDFGDGLTGEGKIIEHIYFQPGLYTVTLSVEADGRTHKAQQKIQVSEPWEKQLNPETDKLESYYSKVAAYNLDQLNNENLLVMVEFFERLGKFDDVIRACSILVNKRRDVNEKDLAKKATLMAKVFVEQRGRPDEAVKNLRAAEAKVADKNIKAALTIEVGHQLLAWRKPDEALNEFKKALTAYASAAREIARKAHIGMGDAFRQKADYEKAKSAYEKATSIPISDLPFRRVAVRIGALSRAAENYIREFDRSKNYDELGDAEDQITTWEWEFPEEKLVGYSTLLKSQCLYRRKNYRQGIREIEELVAVAPKSSYAPEALMLLSDCYQATKDTPKAINALETITTEYRDSPLVKKAKEKIDALKKPPGRK